MRILAIETSCDETAASLIKKSGSSIRILSNIVASQINIHKKFGGVFPEHASRAHTEKIIPVVSETLGNIKPDVIAVTTGPGLIGSLLIGVNFAKTLAYAKNLPIIGINHWLGHIYSNWAEKPLPQFPALILIASGGHTGLVLMKSHNDIVPLGETLDDAAGEAFDKIAKLLELGYPGGPAISKAAEKGDPKAYDFPRSMLERKDFDFSFSGLKTAVLYESRKHNLKNQVMADLAASFQQAVIDILVGKTIQAAYQYHPKSICLCGGVSANKELREQLKKAVAKLPSKTSYHVPPMELSTDNAAMIGIAAAYHLNDKTTYDKISANANLKL
jgi:N6-L-threonylcarbamoyladenine synthase